MNVLLEHEADIEEQNNSDDKLVYIASKYGQIPVIELLLQKGREA